MNVEEKQHFDEIADSFKRYEVYYNTQIDHIQKNFKSMSTRHQSIASKVPTRLQMMREYINHNQKVLDMLVSCDLFDHSQEDGDEKHQVIENSKIMVKKSNIDKVKTTIRQIGREWSTYGHKEREETFKPIFEYVTQNYPLGENEINKYSVLIPGCGLGRLVWEFAKRGYKTQGNEVSYHMLITSNYILNNLSELNAFSLYPNVLETCNNFNFDDQFVSYDFPDVLPNEIPEGVEFSMNAGDFLEIYQDEPDSCDIVVTCFFIDTAQNIVSYLERIYSVLKKGGVWINMGPLLYHFAGIDDQMSLELSFEEIKEIAIKMGFSFEKESRSKTTYDGNVQSMSQYVYDCVFFVAKKL